MCYCVLLFTWYWDNTDVFLLFILNFYFLYLGYDKYREDAVQQHFSDNPTSK